MVFFFTSFKFFTEFNRADVRHYIKANLYPLLYRSKTFPVWFLIVFILSITFLSTSNNGQKFTKKKKRQRRALRLIIYIYTTNWRMQKVGSEKTCVHNLTSLQLFLLFTKKEKTLSTLPNQKKRINYNDAWFY